MTLTKTTKIVLFAFLIATMILPFSTNSFAVSAEGKEEITPSVRVQIKNGVMPENIQCKENRVLVLRDNGSPACVTEKTAEKMDWEIIEISLSKDVLIEQENMLPITTEIKNPIVEEKSTIILNLDNSDEFEQRITEFVDDTITEIESPEITFVLNREIIYGNEGLGGIVTSTSDDSLYWYMVDSDGKAVMPYYQNLSRSGDMSKWSSQELDMSNYGRNSFGTTTNIFAPGEYAIVLFNENIEIKKNFTIMDSKCCRPLTVYASHGAHLPGDEFQIHVKATPQTELVFDLIDPNGKITKTKQITTNKKGEIMGQSFTLSRIAIPGIWTLEVTDGKNSDAIPIIVISTPDELIKKSPTTNEILASYDNEWANKKSGYDVLLASSLESFEDDGREYLYMILEHYPAPTPYYNMIKYGWIDTVGFETNEFGVVTYLDESHEKYSLNHKKGFYLKDWLPDNIPEGQKLLYAQTDYSTYEKNGLINEKYDASYNFVPINFVVDENTTSYDLEHNMGFRIGISYDSWQDEIEDILEEQEERHAEKSGNYGGYKTMMRDGEMIILFEGGYVGRHYENSIYWVFDDNYSINVRSHYYSLEELIPIFNSIMQ